MSVAGYLGPNKPEKMPEGASEEVGISSDGSIMAGKRSASAVRDEESAAASKRQRLAGERLPGGLIRAGATDEFCEDVEDYDPVLRSHCRL